jgi:hypothetical protein
MCGRLERYKLKKSGLRTQPCLTPTEVLKESVTLVSHLTTNETDEYMSLIMFKKYPLIPICVNLYRSAFRHIVSNAAEKSTKQTYKYDLFTFFIYLSISVLRTRT